MLSALMSGALSGLRPWIQVSGITRMHDMSLSVLIIKGEQNLRETCLEQLLREAITGIAIQQIFKAVPRGFHHKTVMFPSSLRDVEYIQSTSYVLVAWVGGVALIQMLVDPDLFLDRCTSRTYLECRIFTPPGLVSVGLVCTAHAHLLQIAC